MGVQHRSPGLRIYMDNLFRLNREKGRNDNILAGLSTAAAAIITGITTAQKPLSILAAVFGLSIALNDAIFQSYLFSQAPGLVSKKVSDMQEVFRNSVVTGKVTGTVQRQSIMRFKAIIISAFRIRSKASCFSQSRTRLPRYRRDRVEILPRGQRVQLRPRQYGRRSFNSKDPRTTIELRASSGGAAPALAINLDVSTLKTLSGC
jgi:hypothetical protein